MEAINANQLLKSLQDRVENHLQQAITTYQNLSNNELNQPSLRGGWSIAQCLEHLNSYGEYYLPAMAQAIRHYNGKPSSTAKRGWLGNYFINAMDPDRTNKKYKATKGHIPEAHLDGHAVVAQFVEQQEELLAILRKASETDLNKVKIPISISRFIRLRLGDTFEFLIIHNERHLRQAKRNLLKEQVN